MKGPGVNRIYWGVINMMKSVFAAGGFAAVLFASPVLAQGSIATAPTPVSTVAAGGVLRAGTSVPLRMVEELTTQGKKLKQGHRFNLETSDAVLVDGNVVIPAGSRAVGEVTHVKNKGMWGKSGKIEGRILYVRVGDRQIRLTGQLDDKGVTGTAGVVGAAVLLPVAGFFMTGTSARIPVGAGLNAFVEEDLPVSFSGTSPAPLVVNAASPAQ